MDAKQHIVKGLLSSPRYIPPVYMYDEDGIKYYERVQRESPHYYVHREELQLLRNNIQVKRGAELGLHVYISEFEIHFVSIKVHNVKQKSTLCHKIWSKYYETIKIKSMNKVFGRLQGLHTALINVNIGRHR